MTVSIRPVRADEMRAANQFLIDVGLTLPTNPASVDAFWAGRGKDNPALKIHSTEVAHGWVLEDDGKMVGFFGNLPLAGTYRGMPVRVACASAWGIHPDYRDHTEDMCRAYFEQPNVDLLMVTSAIKPTARRFEQFDGAAIPQPGLAEIPIGLSMRGASCVRDSVKRVRAKPCRGSWGCWHLCHLILPCACAADAHTGRSTISRQ